MLRILGADLSGLPQDRESLFWLNVLGLPPKTQASQGSVQLAYRTRIKLFYRPSGLAGSPAEAVSRLGWQGQAGGGLRVSNPGPFHISLSEVLLSGPHLAWREGGVLVPGSYDRPAQDKISVLVDTDGDGIVDKDGKKLSIVYQTTVNPVRQDFQALIKDWWTELGVDVELKNIDASVFFGGDAGSPDTFQKFYADVEMYANNFDGTDAEPYMAQYLCDKIPGPENQWQGENINRFCDPAYDALLKELSGTAGIEARGALVMKMNDMLTKDSNIVIPLVDRGRFSAKSNTLDGFVMNSWDSELWNAQDWSRVK